MLLPLLVALPVCFFIGWAFGAYNMTIHDKHAFEDAQIMARAAVEMTERWWKEAYWYGAMQALKAAYKGK